MCTCQREIINKYTGHKLYVKCGKCPACLQEKAAHRVSRIKAEDSPLCDTIMCTLTYRRNDCPYVFREDAYKFAHGEFKDYIYYSSLDDRQEHLEVVDLPLNVYRDHSYRKIRLNDVYDIGYKDTGSKVLCQIDPLYTSKSIMSVKSIKFIDFSNNKDLSHCHGKIGVCYYPDVQEFISRLRINLKRNYGFTEHFKAYCTSEYGSKTLRPHYHILFWIPKGTFSAFRNAINASWPFSDISRFDRSVEKAFRASSYVASYVNCSSDFPDFLKTYFKPKHSFSKDFGVNLNVYSLSSVLSKFDRGHLTFFKQIDKSGIPTICECPFPKYIISRYFPKFKGYNRVNNASRINLMERFAKFDYREKSELCLVSPKSDLINFFGYPCYYSHDDIYRISVRLNNAYKRFLELAPFHYKVSFSDYCRLHIQVWNLFSSDVLRLHLQNKDIVLQEKYDNLEEIKCKYEDNFSLDDNISCVPDHIPKRQKLNYSLPIGFSEDMLVVTDPNLFVSVQLNTSRFEISYHDHLKHRRVSNAIISSSNEEF